MNVGVFGGTFDPPHVGHLLLAEIARDQLALDEVLWVPAGDPPHKKDRPVSHVSHRVNMVNLATEDTAAFRLSLLDVERFGPHYTIDSLKILKNENRNANLFLLLGADSINEFTTWRDYQSISALATVAAMSRGGSEPFSTGVDIDYVEIRGPSTSISATEPQNHFICFGSNTTAGICLFT